MMRSSDCAANASNMGSGKSGATRKRPTSSVGALGTTASGRRARTFFAIARSGLRRSLMVWLTAGWKTRGMMNGKKYVLCVSIALLILSRFSPLHSDEDNGQVRVQESCVRQLHYVETRRRKSRDFENVDMQILQPELCPTPRVRGWGGDKRVIKAPFGRNILIALGETKERACALGASEAMTFAVRVIDANLSPRTCWVLAV